MANKDLQLITAIKGYIKNDIPKYLYEVGFEETETKILEHPLDEDVVKQLSVFDIRQTDARGCLCFLTI